MAIVVREEIRRYEAGERLNHWAVALLFLLLAASGLAFFHPSFWFLSALLGGGTWARILHPFLGVLMFVLFVGMALRYWPENRIEQHDREWRKHMFDFIANRDEHIPEVGKYNLGQKWTFWIQVVTVVLLLVSGIILWRPYFAPAFPIVAIRIAAVVHALAGFILILAIIIHVYAALWVPGSLRGMTRGTVTRAWARRHHPLWYRKVTGRAGPD